MCKSILWSVQTFEQLSNRDLYDILALRDQVFVLEQQSIYGDIDGLDPDCWHLSGRNAQGQLLAYARCIPPALIGQDVYIGRLVTAPSVRGVGLGRVLMQTAMTLCQEKWPTFAISLSAQMRLQAFYESFGYIAHGEPYDDGGILHVHMTRPAKL